MNEWRTWILIVQFWNFVWICISSSSSFLQDTSLHISKVYRHILGEWILFLCGKYGKGLSFTLESMPYWAEKTHMAIGTQNEEWPW